MAIIRILYNGTWKPAYGKNNTTSYKKGKINVGGTFKVPTNVKLRNASTWKTISK